MKIFKAMKKIKKIKGEIQNIQNRIHSNISTVEENEFEEQYADLEKQLIEKTDELINTKNAIMEANIDNKMYKKILEIGELKSRINFLNSLEIKKGVVRDSYALREVTPSKFKTQLTNKDRGTKVKDLEERVHSLIDELDDFNATTPIDIIE